MEFWDIGPNTMRIYMKFCSRIMPYLTRNIECQVPFLRLQKSKGLYNYAGDDNISLYFIIFDDKFWEIILCIPWLSTCPRIRILYVGHYMWDIIYLFKFNAHSCAALTSLQLLKSVCNWNGALSDTADIAWECPGTLLSINALQSGILSGKITGRN